MEREMEQREEIIKNILEEYEQAGRKRRNNLWLMFVELRDEFDEIERCAKCLPRKFGVDPYQICCGG